MFFLADVDKWVGSESVAPVWPQRTGRAWTVTPVVPFPIAAPFPADMAILASRRVPQSPRSPERVSHSIRIHPGVTGVDESLAYLSTGTLLVGQHGRRATGKRYPAQTSYVLESEPPGTVPPLSGCGDMAMPPRQARPGRARSGVQTGGEAEELLALPHHWVDGWLAPEQGAGPRRVRLAIQPEWVAPAWPVAVGEPADSAIFAAYLEGTGHSIQTARLMRQRDASAWAWPGGDGPPGWVAVFAAPMLASTVRPVRDPAVRLPAQADHWLTTDIPLHSWGMAVFAGEVSTRSRPRVDTGHTDRGADSLHEYADASAPSPVILCQPVWPARALASERRSTGELVQVRELVEPHPAVLVQQVAAARVRGQMPAPHQEFSSPDWHGAGLIVYAGLGYCAAGDVFVSGAVAGNVVRE